MKSVSRSFRKVRNLVVICAVTPIGCNCYRSFSKQHAIMFRSIIFFIFLEIFFIVYLNLYYSVKSKPTNILMKAFSEKFYTNPDNIQKIR